MKIYVFALMILLFSGLVTVFNHLGILNQKLYEPGYNVNQSEANGIFQVDSSNTIDDKSDWFDQFAGGFAFTLKTIGIVWKGLGLALNLGALVTKYVPGPVGLSIGVFVTAITYFIYAWGGVQLWKKISSKLLD